MDKEYTDKVGKKSVPRGMVLSVLIIVVIAGAGACLFLTRSGGGGGGAGGGVDNQGGGGTTPSGSGTITPLTGMTLSDAVTQIQNYAATQGYSDAQLTYTAQGSNFTREGKADWSNIILYSSGSNVKVEYVPPENCIIDNAPNPIETVTSYIDTSQIAAQNQEIWNFAESQQSSSIGIRIYTYPGPGAYHAQKVWRITVSYGPPDTLGNEDWWFNIATGQKIA